MNYEGHDIALLRFLSASLYVSKRGAYWDRLCRDVVGCHARALWPNGASYAYSYYGTLIGNPTPGIQWYNFRPPGVTPNRGMGPPWGAFLSNYFDLLLRMPTISQQSPTFDLIDACGTARPSAVISGTNPHEVWHGSIDCTDVFAR